MSAPTLNLFPARVPIGRLTLPDGTEVDVMSSPEFFRALSLVFARLGGPSGMGSEDLALLVSQVLAGGAVAQQDIADLQGDQRPDHGAQLAIMAARIEDMERQVQVVGNLTAELSALRQRLADIEIVATYRDPFRVDWERPGKIGQLTPNTGSFTRVNAITGTVSLPAIYLDVENTTGLYRVAADSWGLAIAGVNLVTWSATGGAYVQNVSTTKQFVSTVVTGTAPLVVASTTKVANLNVDQLDGGDWASPGAIGGTAASSAAFTTVTASGGYTTALATALITSSVAMNNGAAAAAGTLGNAPVVGDPTKWIPIVDNGTTRYIPAW